MRRKLKALLLDLYKKHFDATRKAMECVDAEDFNYWQGYKFALEQVIKSIEKE